MILPRFENKKAMDQRCVDTECVVVTCFNFFIVGFHITSPFLFQILVPSNRPTKKKVRKVLYFFGISFTATFAVAQFFL